MTVQGALSSAVSGLQSQARALGTVSDNISNGNSISFKRAEVRFISQVTHQGSSSSSFIPGGTQAQSFINVDQQGITDPTQNPTDLAVNGGGWFVVKKDVTDTSGAQYYTRSGDFQVDLNGNLKNSAGMYLFGWQLDADGNTDFGATSAVNVKSFASPAQQTTDIEIDLNLPATAGIGVAADIETFEIQVFDSLGVPLNLELQWERVAIPGGAPAGTSAAWEVTVSQVTLVSDGSNAISAGSVTVSPTEITFDQNGKPNADPTLTLDFGGVTLSTGGFLGDGTDNEIDVDLGSVGQTDGVTMNASNFSVRKKTQNGIPFGVFESVAVSQDGLVTATFTNGQKRDLYLLPLATFNDSNSLELLRGGVYLETTQSGNPILQAPNSGQAGGLESFRLEASTVDIADEFTRMIVIQRAYTANARLITTSSEMLEEITRIV